jgi:soluble lytic murein transglycosylase-like protein
VPSDAAYALSGDEAVSIICRAEYGWDCEEALAVAWRESNWQPSAVSPDGCCVGLFQINRYAHGHSLSALFDPIENVAIAHDLWLKEGWKPWRS